MVAPDPDVEMEEVEDGRSEGVVGELDGSGDRKHDEVNESDNAEEEVEELVSKQLEGESALTGGSRVCSEHFTSSASRS
jgi:hypothetical protein